MEKLLNLLKEYEEEKAKTEGKMYEWRIEGEDIIGENLILGGDESINVCEDIICGKRYGFITRLVENNKINSTIGFENYNGWTLSFRREIVSKKHESIIKTHTMLMLLSIQDDPVKFLSSVLLK